MPVRNTPAVLSLCVLLLLGACAPKRAPVRSVQAVAGLSIDDAALRQWSFLYRQISGVEWMACLYGREDARGIHIERSELADVREANYAAVSGTCSERPGARLVGLAHSHPPLPDGRPSCLPSGMDMRDLGRPWRIVVVVCNTAEDRVTVGYRAEGRHPVIKTLDVRSALPPLVLGDAQSAKER